MEQQSEIEQWLNSQSSSQVSYIQTIQDQTTLWAPQSIPQWMALLSPADELYYGGQAGGGKTDLLLGCALTQHIDSLIFRREYSQMTGAQGLIDRSREIIGKRGRYNGQEHVWRDLPGDRSLEFGSMPREYDKYRYLGRPHDFIGFDEITEMLRTQYEFVIRWNRTTIEEQRSRIICAGNPPMHVDGRWVIDYWAPWIDEKHPNRAQPGELRWFARIDDESIEVAEPGAIEHKGEMIVPRSRTFIPATLADNPYLGEAYAALLADAPEPLRSQLLLGDFTAGIKDDAWQVIPTEWVRLAQERWAPDGQNGHCDAVGSDPSRGGRDEFIIAHRFGTWFASLITHQASEAEDGDAGAALIVKSLLDVDGKPEVNIDVIGIGSSVYDSTKKLLPNVHGVNFAAGASGTDRSGKFRFRNVRARAYWNFREALDPKKGEGLALPPDSQLLGDLTAARYSITSGGILIEDKEKIKKRLGRSPDRGDAVILTHYQSLQYAPTAYAGRTN